MRHWLWTFLLDFQHPSCKGAFLDQCPNSIIHADSPPQRHGVTGSSSRWNGTSRGALQLENNPSLLFEVRGFTTRTSSDSATFAALSLLGGELSPPEGER